MTQLYHLTNAVFNSVEKDTIFDGIGTDIIYICNNSISIGSSFESSVNLRLLLICI